MSSPREPSPREPSPREPSPREPSPRELNPAPLLLAFGLLAFALAGLSIADMFLPRPYDGVVLDSSIKSRLVVREVIEGSGADAAGLREGDVIVGIAREMLRDPARAGRVIHRFRVGEKVVYLIKRQNERLEEYEVRLGRRRLGDGTYLYITLIGFSFFFVGLFVLMRQPGLRASQIFFLLCGLFLLFLVCRLRPPSYSSIDTLILGLGTVSFLFLPAAFLHFYLLFPRPSWLEALEERASWRSRAALWRRFWPVLYAVPPLVFAVSFASAEARHVDLHLVHGAPNANWWLLAAYMVLGFWALRANRSHLRDARQRRGVNLVLAGSSFGLSPFLIASFVPSVSFHSRAFFVAGILPLLLVPITFTYAIVRFQLLDIRVILRRSLLYTVTTALVTSLYAGGIATFNAVFHDSKLIASGYFPLFLAVAIVLLFEPLRRRLQELIDRYFFAERSRLQRAMVELGEAMTAQVDLQEVVQELVERLPQLLGLRFAALYLKRGREWVRVAGPRRLPERLPELDELREVLRRRGRLTRVDQLIASPMLSGEATRWVEELAAAGVEAMGDLASPRRAIGLVMLSDKEGQIPFEKEELELLRGLLHQVALALETSLLLEERTQQAELERELEIAATIQAQLLPDRLEFAAGWRVVAVCRPARIVGGDFFTQLPAPNGGRAVVFGDVAGKSVSGALMMMAAHEALHALALTRPDPAELFTLTNRRVYGLGKRNFVALGYFSATEEGRFSYLIAGQPPPLVRRVDGSVEELPLPYHRIPVGALADGLYEALETEIGLGEVVLGYSDGVTDARGAEGEFFGIERLREVLASASGDPDEVVGAVLAAVERFTNAGPQYDDLTLVAVGREVAVGKESEPMR